MVYVVAGLVGVLAVSSVTLCESNCDSHFLTMVAGVGKDVELTFLAVGGGEHIAVTYVAWSKGGN